MKSRHHPAVQVIPIAVLLLTGCNTSLQVPGDEAGAPVGTQGGFPSIPPAGPSGEDPAGAPAGDMPGGMSGGGDGARAGMPPGGTQGGIGSGGLDEVLDKSLGDFDKQMGRERAGVMTGGQGTGGAAGQRESADESAVKTAGMRGGGSIGGMGGSDQSGRSGKTGAGDGPAGGSAGSAGQSDAGSRGGDGSGSDIEGARSAEPGEERVADLPEDITVDESAEDQVARQIREAAQAEKDPVIRDALWEEYRKHMGIR